ncbi:MAG TPA: hypothetical protein VMO26_11320 [Vicinamibacterales bacterium]|nr:hypothetical protein [Vicinamibacterales bacterium]
MSTNVSGEEGREALRDAHEVRLVTAAEEGSAAEALPAGVYGFTGSPVLASPLFAVRRYRNFEVHRLATGVSLVGFVAPGEAARLTEPSGQTVSLNIYPDLAGEATAIVSIPYDRIVQHRQYANRSVEALALQVVTAHALSI